MGLLATNMSAFVFEAWVGIFARSVHSNNPVHILNLKQFEDATNRYKRYVPCSLKYSSSFAQAENVYSTSTPLCWH